MRLVKCDKVVEAYCTMDEVDFAVETVLYLCGGFGGNFKIKSKAEKGTVTVTGLKMEEKNE